MSNKKIVVDQLKFTYEGLFDFSELYALITAFFQEKGYDRREQLSKEQRTRNGKQIKIELKPKKNINEYTAIRQKLNIVGHNIKKVQIEKNGSKQKIDKGKIKFTLDGILITDRDDQWSHTPFMWFIRQMMDKYILGDHHIKAEKILLNDIEQFQSEIESYLNTQGQSKRGPSEV